MKYQILLTAPYMLPFVGRFKPVLAKYDLELIVPDVHERMEEADLWEYAGQFDGTICGDDRYTERVIQACAPRLRVISKWGTGIELDRRRGLLPLWHQGLPYPERIHPPRRGHRPRLHPGVCTLPAVDGPGNEERKVGKDPRKSPQ